MHNGMGEGLDPLRTVLDVRSGRAGVVGNFGALRRTGVTGILGTKEWFARISQEIR